MRRDAAFVRDKGSRFLHQRNEVDRRHGGNQDIAGIEQVKVLGTQDNFDNAAHLTSIGAESADGDS